MGVDEISFGGFNGRDVALASVLRYGDRNLMVYRTNLDTHARRVEWIAMELYRVGQQALPSLDPFHIRCLARVHDDAEMITGDVVLAKKLQMSPQERDALRRMEQNAIETLANRFPHTVHGFSYRSLLYEVLNKETLEVQLVILADKLDAYGEALHELYAGNEHFLTHSYGTASPHITYPSILNGFPTKFPALAPLFSVDHPLLKPAGVIDGKLIVARGSPHTTESVRISTGIPHYDAWREITIQHGALDWLVQQIEFREVPVTPLS